MQQLAAAHVSHGCASYGLQSNKSQTWGRYVLWPACGMTSRYIICCSSQDLCPILLHFARTCNPLLYCYSNCHAGSDFDELHSTSGCSRALILPHSTPLQDMSQSNACGWASLTRRRPAFVRISLSRCVGDQPSMTSWPSVPCIHGKLIIIHCIWSIVSQAQAGIQAANSRLPERHAQR